MTAVVTTTEVSTVPDILLAAAELAAHQGTAGQAVTVALYFLDSRYPAAEVALERAMHRPQGISIAMVLSARCGTARQVADAITRAALERAA